MIINKIRLNTTFSDEYPCEIDYEDEEEDLEAVPERMDDICEYPELGYYFGCEQCADCPMLSMCRDRDKYSMFEDSYREGDD